MKREIIFLYGNQTEYHHGMARNHSRLSLYFESARALVPGTLIFIRTTSGEWPEPTDTGKQEEIKPPAGLNDTDEQGPVCRELKTVVTAEVKRCVRIADSNAATFGIGAEYVSPAV